MTTVAIVGTAGRQANLPLSKELFTSMKQMVKDQIDRFCLHPSKITLVSGGAGWADHVAVQLYLERYCGRLHLYLPCAFDQETMRFYDNGKYDWRVNMGKTANYYHDKMRGITGIDSLAEIGLAIQKGCETTVIDGGFYARNSFIAKSAYLIAMTFSDSDTPVDGGTLDTWRKCKGKKIHISLNNLSSDKE